MPIKLYGVLPSPPVRAVLLCAKALGIEVEFVNVSLVDGEHLKEDFLKKNPQHTVPVIEDEDGFILSDSHAIMAYLVTKYGKDDSLYPAGDAKHRAIIDQRLHFDSSTLFSGGLAVCKPLIYKGIKPKQEQIDALREAYGILDTILAINKTQYVAGNTVSIADFSIVTTVTSWECLLPNDKFPHIKAYVERMQKYPYYEVIVEGSNILKNLILTKLEN
ncbi:glutathione S-transferase 1-like [Rhynchophorus ferrugineus]|uniref:Uncharacterized protein n=1 Tax=Rhynchophorus ferrugineus TaxID=354439 RepID=A0A834HRA6_RHYFE|nr:hypothetical protein GWI33_019490 [Rhynchophorus ferrugineus]